MAESREGKRSKVYAVILLLIVILALSIFLGGSEGFFSIMGKLFWLILIALFLIAVGYAFYKIFIEKHKIDVNYLNFKNIIQSAQLSKPLVLGDLYLMGDREHTSVRLGTIIGYTRIKNLSTRNSEDVFVVQTASFPASLFTEPHAIRVATDDHTELVGDVYLRGISLIRIGEFFYLNNVMDKPAIDLTHKEEAFRLNSHLTLSDMKGLTDIATGIDTEHKKKIEGTNLMQLPLGSQPQQSQNK